MANQSASSENSQKTFCDVTCSNKLILYFHVMYCEIGAAMNKESLNQRGITHVINWSSSAKCNTFPDIQYFCIKGIRSGHGMIKYLDKAVEFIESARKSGGFAMSHCWYGRNRSVTLLVAYLMKYNNMTAKKANTLIQKTRPQAAPYWDSLEDYRKFLKAEKLKRRKRKRMDLPMENERQHDG